MLLRKSITLNPGEQGQVIFEIKPTEARIYQATIDGLSGSFEAVSLITPGWRMDTVDQYLEWQAWGSIDPNNPFQWWRQEAVGRTDGYYPYTEGEDLAGKTLEQWIVEPLSYLRIIIDGLTAVAEIGPAYYATYEYHTLGLNDPKIVEYFKPRVPTGVPLCLMFFGGDAFTAGNVNYSEMEQMFKAWESSQVADVTNVFIHPYAVVGNLCARVIIYDFSGFATIAERYNWTQIHPTWAKS